MTCPAMLSLDGKDAQLRSKVLSHNGFAVGMIDGCATLIDDIATLTRAGTFVTIAATFTAYDPAVAADAPQLTQLRSQEAFHG